MRENSWSLVRENSDVGRCDVQFCCADNNSAVEKIRIQVLENSDVGRWEMMRVLFFVCFFVIFFWGEGGCAWRGPLEIWLWLLTLSVNSFGFVQGAQGDEGAGMGSRVPEGWLCFGHP